MLRALYERAISPDLIVGTSVGAINGAFISSRPTRPETADDLAAVWHGLGRSQVFPVNPLSGFLGFFGVRNNLVPDGALRRLLREHLQFELVENAGIPLHAITTDLLSGSELRLSKGPALQALMASAAIPGIFPPVRWEGRDLVDGGVSNNAPISDAIALGAETIYVLPTGTACDLPEAPRGALAMLLHSTTLLVIRRLLLEVELLSDRAELIVLPPPCPLAISPIDFAHSEALIRRGYEDADADLDRLDRERAAGLPMAA